MDMISTLADTKHGLVFSIIPDLVCIYCRKKIDLAKHPYTLIKNQSGNFAYHYICYDREQTEVITISHEVKEKLGAHLLNLKAKGNMEKWIDNLLISCGYKWNQ